VLRADVDRIIIGDRCNIQDLACIHQSGGSPAILGNDVSLGHGAVVHGATVCDGALIGMNAVVLDKAVVGPGAIIAAGAVVLEGTKVPANEIWGGIPANASRPAHPAPQKSMPSTT
jgi:carbonic anhydrase/acetyltransferase-like protein (isoleucine patch superfamily)